MKKDKPYDVVIVGGGASGFFLANLLMDKSPDLHVLILEKTGKTLQKVKISGGGRCNVTHNQPSPSMFSKNYPRGENFLKNKFTIFGQLEMINWLEEKGIHLKTEGDNRMFPQSNSSQTIVDCLFSVTNKKNCSLQSNFSLESFEYENGLIALKHKEITLKTKKLVLAPGSSESLWKLLENKGINVISRVPSLFSFKFLNHPMLDLAGVSMQKVSIRLQGSKLTSTGPWLVTHQGISGPAVLKLSAFAARNLHETNYNFDLAINFTNAKTWDEVNAEVQLNQGSQKHIVNQIMYDIPKRLWSFLLLRSGIEEEKKWVDLTKKEANKLTEELFQGIYKVNGKNTFKDEFVTAGGVDLTEIDSTSCELKKLPNVYCIGEFLNIDGVTGGFNFQNCWTTGYLAAQSILNNVI